MVQHRLVPPSSYECVDFRPPFSSFSHIENTYGESFAIRRLFSLARSHARSQETKTLITERIDPVGIIADENNEIKQYLPDHSMEDLHRLSFWESSFTEPNSTVCSEDKLIGYAILKHDVVPSKRYDRWHVFEAVFEKYQHRHNCVPKPYPYTINLVGNQVSVKGLLYAQQNELNKSCAQVALRSLISRIIDNDVPYSKINDFARQTATNFNPAAGLNVQQIRSVLNGFNIPFRDKDYSQHNRYLLFNRFFNFGKKVSDKMRESQPYQAYVYPGVESGMGALVGFRLSGAGQRKHIIPFYGHTFNKDTWAPDADIAYFKVGKNLGYISSQNWTSSFLGHDDNFGPNYCVPRLYIGSSNVDYVVELLKPRFSIRGAQAEGLSLYLLHSVLNQIDITNNTWLERLASRAYSAIYPQIVLRAIAVDKEDYINHIRQARDWDGNVEKAETIELFNDRLPDSFWVVEISIPHLFPANERKLGDIVIDGQIELNVENIYRHLIYVRLPKGYYILTDPPDTDGEINFRYFPSDLTSHVDVMRLD